LYEQRLRLFQIGGVEAIGKPAVNRREEIARFGPPALLAPQPGEAGRSAQLIGLGLLPARDAQRLLEGALGFFEPVETQQRDAFEAMKFRLPAALPRSSLVLQSLPHCSESLLVLTLPRERFSQPGQAVVMQPNSAGPG